MNLKEAQEFGIAPWQDLYIEEDTCVIFRDSYPVTPGHLLFVPKYSTTPCILEAMETALRWGQHEVEHGCWDGFNIGLNWGEAAGQTVTYPHVHLIPRQHGDCEDPVGGVRNVIPGKGNYKRGNT